jgi:Spy/CpxP family protein refolding chaperone
MPTPAATTAATAAASTATMASAATTPATATGESYPLGGRRQSGIFVVEDIEGRQTDVGEFLLTKKEFVTL